MIIINNRNNKKGAALVIALFFAFCMLILMGALVFRQSSTASHNLINLIEKQAFFASRSAIQHFLLKAKLFPTELYDAVEISKGKNPLFNFTEFPDHNNFEECFGIGIPDVYTNKDDQLINNKPRYYYIKLPNKDSFIRMGSYYNPDYRFLAPNIYEDEIDKKYTDPKKVSESYHADKFLKYYYRDCINYEEDNVDLQPLLKTEKSNNIKNPNKFDIAEEPLNSYPYTMRYKIKEINVKAIQGMRKYGEEAIEIKVIGTVINFQNKKHEQEQNLIQNITRKGSYNNEDFE
jgi:hypothetical protein